jgi:drug/metabolite transporter (DMT)-like permease
MTAERAAVLRGNLLLVVSTFAWASAFPATEVLLTHWHPMLVATARIGGGAVALLVVLAVMGRLRGLRHHPWGRYTRLGAVGFAGGAAFIVVGQAFADPVTAAVISTTMPLVSAVMGLVERSERLSTRLAAGIALAVIGGTVASVAPMQAGFTGLRGGEILILLSQVCWAWFSRRSLTALAGLEPIARAAYPMLGGAVVLAALTAGLAATGAIEPSFRLASLDVALLLWIATVGIGLSVTLWLMAARTLGVTVAATHVNLGPFYVMLIALATGGTVVLGQVAGAALVAAGAVVAQLRRAAALTPPAPAAAAVASRGAAPPAPPGRGSGPA